MNRLHPALNRSRRLRKKLRIDEFQALGFRLGMQLRPDLDGAQVDVFIDRFLLELAD